MSAKTPTLPCPIPSAAAALAAIALAASPARGTHFEARGCQVFLDKVVPLTASHGATSFYAYVKIRPEELPSPVVRVGFHAVSRDPDARCAQHRFYGCDDVGVWRSISAERFFGADDYFAIWLMLQGDMGYPRAWEGAFYAETAQGDFYWLHGPGGGNFRFDAMTHGTLEGIYGRLGWATPILYVPLQDVPKTADFLVSLNPQACR